MVRSGAALPPGPHPRSGLEADVTVRGHRRRDGSAARGHRRRLPRTSTGAMAAPPWTPWWRPRPRRRRCGSARSEEEPCALRELVSTAGGSRSAGLGCRRSRREHPKTAIFDLDTPTEHYSGPRPAAPTRAVAGAHATSAGLPPVTGPARRRWWGRPHAGCRRRPTPRRTAPGRCRPASAPARGGRPGRRRRSPGRVARARSPGTPGAPAPRRPARRPCAVSTRCAPEVSTSSGSPSASNTSELAIWPTSTPSAAAAAAAVVTASGSTRMPSRARGAAPPARRWASTRSTLRWAGPVTPA